MGNDTVSKTVGVGSIDMKMFDEHVQTLKDVRNVPDLRKNLLSLGTLKAQRCKFSDMDRALKFTKGSMTVLKAECMENLYNMIGSMVIDNDSEATEEDVTRLWHMRLEHMSEVFEPYTTKNFY